MQPTDANLSGGMGLSAVSQVAGSYAGYQAGMTNARIADSNAMASLNNGNAQMLASKAQYGAAIGRQAAAQGASGFAMGTGSNLDALEQSRINEAYSSLSIMHEAQARAVGFQNQAAMERSGATSKLVAGVIGGAAGIMNKQIDYANANRQYGVDPSDPSGVLQPDAGPVMTNVSGFSWGN